MTSEDLVIDRYQRTAQRRLRAVVATGSVAIITLLAFATQFMVNSSLAPMFGATKQLGYLDALALVILFRLMSLKIHA